MSLSYCVKEKKANICFPGSERYEQSKNNRMMMKCTCASCGITTTRFVKTSTVKGSGLLDMVIPIGAITAAPLAFSVATVGSSKIGRDQTRFESS